MKVTCFLVVSETGTVKVLKSQPNLDWDQISIRLNLDLPKELFRRPTLSANVTVPPEAVATANVDVDVVGAIQNAIQVATGYDVRVSLVSQEGGAA